MSNATNILFDIIINLFIQRDLQTRLQIDRQFIHGTFSPQTYYQIKSDRPIQAGLIFYAFFGSLKELFKDTIRLNTRCSSLESFWSTQKYPCRTNWKLSPGFASLKFSST